MSLSVWVEVAYISVHFRLQIRWWVESCPGLPLTKITWPGCHFLINILWHNTTQKRIHGQQRTDLTPDLDATFWSIYYATFWSALLCAFNDCASHGRTVIVGCRFSWQNPADWSYSPPWSRSIVTHVFSGEHPWGLLDEVAQEEAEWAWHTAQCWPIAAGSACRHPIPSGLVRFARNWSGLTCIEVEED
jgi:hypothetical protein